MLLYGALCRVLCHYCSDFAEGEEQFTPSCSCLKQHLALICFLFNLQVKKYMMLLYFRQSGEVFSKKVTFFLIPEVFSSQIKSKFNCICR